MDQRNGTRDTICSFIGEYYLCHGYGPSCREIGRAVNLKSTSTVHGHLCRMERAGLITTSDEKGQPRTIVPTDKLFELIHATPFTAPVVIPRSYSVGTALISPYLDHMVFANSLRTLREAKHLTREQLAEMAGLSYYLVCAHERGEILPRESTLEKYAAALNVPMVTPQVFAECV